MFNTYFMLDTLTVGEGQHGHVDLIPILQALHRREFRNVTDSWDRGHNMEVFVSEDASEVFIIEPASR